MDVFRHYFLNHPGTQVIPEFWRSDIVLDEEILWIIKTEKTWEFAKKMVCSYFLLVL